jgi:Tol biopolymer transport system component
VAAIGPAYSPHLVMLKHDTHVLESMNVAGAVRYPALSPEGRRVAFSRREQGMWHLFVRDVVSKGEEQLTHSSCNATYSSWQDANTLLYATDCGRGVGLTSIARVRP